MQGKKREGAGSEQDTASRPTASTGNCDLNHPRSTARAWREVESGPVEPAFQVILLCAEVGNHQPSLFPSDFLT
jgi:hypothetical protein